MKNILIAAASAALVVGVATNALAVSTTGTSVQINGTVDPTCFFSNTGGSTHNFDDLTNDNAILLDSSHTFDLGNSYCNKAFSLTVTSANGAMIPDTNHTAVGSFRGYVDYTATAKIGATGTPVMLDTSTVGTHSGPETAENTDTGQAEQGNLSLEVNIDSGQSANPLLQGTYSDTISIVVDASI